MNQLPPMQYRVGDVVAWPEGGQERIGTICIADFGGSLEMLGQSHSYDIMTLIDNQETLIKHIPEGKITRLISKSADQRTDLERLRDQAAEFDAPASRIPFDPADGLSMATEDGVYRMITRSGSTYRITIAGAKRTMLRVNNDAALRGDGVALPIIYMNAIIGLSGYFVLEPLGSGAVTTRMTSPVDKVERL